MKSGISSKILLVTRCRKQTTRAPGNTLIVRFLTTTFETVSTGHGNISFVRSCEVHSTSMDSSSNKRLISVSDPPSPVTLPVQNSVIPEQPQLIESPKMTNIHQFVSEQQGHKQTALRILGGNFKDVEYTEYANYLGSPAHKDVCHEFIKLLQPLPLSLVSTLRKIANNLYFVAEAGCIDTILEEVSMQWLEQHNVPHYQGNFRLCHIVLFALLILNSDLHNPASQDKFSCDQFVDNTVYALHRELETIDVEVFCNDLRAYYASLQQDQLPLRRMNSTASSGTTAKNSTGNSAMRKPSMFSLRPSSRGLERTSSRTSFASTTASMAPSTTSTKPSISSHVVSNWKYHHNQALEKLYLAEDFDDEMTKKNHTSWMMDSFIQYMDVRAGHASHSTSNTKQPRKTLFSWFRKNSSKDSLFNERTDFVLDMGSNWFNSRVRIAEGRLFIFNFKSSSNIDKTWDLDVCKKKASTYYVYNLFGTVAKLTQENIIASSSTKNKKKWNFTITFPKFLLGGDKDTMFNFQTSDLSTAKMYVQSCNFWSGRISPIPAAEFEMVSNQEYGWSDALLQGKLDPLSTKLVVWTPLVNVHALYYLDDGSETDLVLGQQDIESKIHSLECFTDKLSQWIDQHNALKPHMVSVWSASANSSLFDKAMDNWNDRYLYLNFKYEKHMIYLKALEQALRSLN